jgi:hypothetical protein
MCLLRIVGIILLLFVAWVAFNSTFTMQHAFYTMGGLCLAFVPNLK